MHEYSVHIILSASEAFGWKMLNDRTKSPNSITPLRLTSKRSNTCKRHHSHDETRDSLETRQMKR